MSTKGSHASTAHGRKHNKHGRKYRPADSESDSEVDEHISSTAVERKERVPVAEDVVKDERAPVAGKDEKKRAPVTKDGGKEDRESLQKELDKLRADSMELTILDMMTRSRLYTITHDANQNLTKLHALERMLAGSSEYKNEDGSPLTLTDEQRDDVQKEIAECKKKNDVNVTRILEERSRMLDESTKNYDMLSRISMVEQKLRNLPPA